MVDVLVEVALIARPRGRELKVSEQIELIECPQHKLFVECVSILDSCRGNRFACRVQLDLHR